MLLSLLLLAHMGCFCFVDSFTATTAVLVAPPPTDRRMCRDATQRPALQCSSVVAQDCSTSRTGVADSTCRESTSEMLVAYFFAVEARKSC